MNEASGAGLTAGLDDKGAPLTQRRPAVLTRQEDFGTRLFVPRVSRQRNHNVTSCVARKGKDLWFANSARLHQDLFNQKTDKTLLLKSANSWGITTHLRNDFAGCGNLLGSIPIIWQYHIYPTKENIELLGAAHGGNIISLPQCLAKN